MILYLDTSSLVKLYVSEPHSSLVKKWVSEAEIAASCRVAYPEMVSALSRRFREGDLTKKQYELLINKFSDEWKHFASIDFDEIEAGRLARAYGLRGFDAVHLSSAMLLKSQNEIALAFSSFDEALNRAAKAEGIEVLSTRG